MTTLSSHTGDTTVVETYYGDAFYQGQLGESERSAREYVPFLLSLFRPESVLDVGCGRGAWLKVFAENGVRRVVGFDGSWNRAEDMIDPRIEFSAVELDRGFKSDQALDLAMSLEVAEHLRPESSSAFVESLVGCADAVMFAAAYSGQGGTNHINERPHSFWGALFDQAGYDAFDVFRPSFWGNQNVCYWYRQNTFLYVRRGSARHAQLSNDDIRPVRDLAFLDCVHPELFSRSSVQPSPLRPPTFRLALRDLGSAFMRSIRHRLVRTAP